MYTWYEYGTLSFVYKYSYVGQYHVQTLLLNSKCLPYNVVLEPAKTASRVTMLQR